MVCAVGRRVHGTTNERLADRFRDENPNSLPRPETPIRYLTEMRKAALVLLVRGEDHDAARLDALADQACIFRPDSTTVSGASRPPRPVASDH